MKNFLRILFLFFAAQGFSQADNHKDDHSLKEKELQSLCTALFSAKTDAQKQKYNSELLQKFEAMLNEPGSFENYQFDSLNKFMYILRPPDNTFRIINWNIENNDGTYGNYGFIQSKHIEIKKKGFRRIKNEVMQLYPLIDKSAEIKNPENAVTDNKKWFGMLYYKVIHTKYKSKNYYTLLAKDENDKISQKKIIDVLTFDNQGVPHFGADIFNFQKKYPKRIIFEYSAACSMSLKYSTKKDSIIFGHLAPIEPQLEGQFQYYCSDMSFDGFGFKKGKWNYGADVKAMNDKAENDKMYHDPHDRSTTNNQSNKVIERKKKFKKPK
jgi:hypothetical protein